MRLLERGDLDKALTRAKKRNHSLLVFFTGNPLHDDARKMLKTTLQQPANMQAMKDDELIKAIVIKDLDSDLARRYKVKSVPTMLLLSPNGKERNRREGFIEGTPFRTGFLSCKVIQRP